MFGVFCRSAPSALGNGEYGPIQPGGPDIRSDRSCIFRRWHPEEQFPICVRDPDGQLVILSDRINRCEHFRRVHDKRHDPPNGARLVAFRISIDGAAQDEPFSTLDELNRAVEHGLSRFHGFPNGREQVGALSEIQSKGGSVWFERMDVLNDHIRSEGDVDHFVRIVDEAVDDARKPLDGQIRLSLENSADPFGDQNFLIDRPFERRGDCTSTFGHVQALNRVMLLICQNRRNGCRQNSSDRNDQIS